MIVIRVWGGIGNQLFQYVFGEYLHYKYQQDVCYDNNSFGAVDKLRKPELYIISPKISLNNQYSFSHYRGIKNRLLRFYFQLKPHNHYLEEGGIIPSEYKTNHIYYFQGYWQNISFYKDLLCLKPDFVLKCTCFPGELFSFKAKIKSQKESVSIHVRRGDYFSPQNIKTYGVCTEEYYKQAFEIIREKYPNVVPFIFSDDLEWVKEHLNFINDAVLIPNYDIPQFSYIELMSLCKHHIISNSSFSWWGAVIRGTDDGMVICPSKWKLTSETTIALDNWIKI